MKISVITPFYYGNQYIVKLIDMIEKNTLNLKQRYNTNEVEYIIINDSPQIQVMIPEYSKSYELKVINLIKNSGIHQARITGLSLATGDYVVFLDQDDEIINDCFVKELEAIGTADLLICNAYIQKSDGTLSLCYQSKGEFKNAMQLQAYIKAHNQIVSPGHCMIKKEAIPSEWSQYIMNINGSDDLFLWILMLAKRKKVVICNEIVYIHKYTGKNLSAKEEMSYSSLEMAQYFRKIEYISPSIINTFIRNRNMKLQFSSCSIFDKVKLIIRNIDILLPRIWWKIKANVQKY